MQISLDFGKVLEKVKLGNSFLVFGGVFVLISLVYNNPLGIKIGLLTFIFGGVFRLLNLIANSKKVEKTMKDHTDSRLVKLGLSLKAIIFIIWIMILGLYCSFLNKLVQIFIF